MFLIIIYWSRSQNWTLYVFWLVSLEEIDSNASVVNSSWLLSSFELFSSLLICFSLVVNGSFCLSTSGVCWNGSFKSSLSFFYDVFFCGVCGEIPSNALFAFFSCPLAEIWSVSLEDLLVDGFVEMIGCLSLSNLFEEITDSDVSSFQVLWQRHNSWRPFQGFEISKTKKQ